jgi:hypothetical protein
VVQTLTTILTVVTAIGAIWAALASTSQARARFCVAVLWERREKAASALSLEARFAPGFLTPDRLRLCC